MLNSCCFCVRLRTACLAIGFTYIGVNVATLLAWLVFSVCVAASTTREQYNSYRAVHHERLLIFFVYVLLPMLLVCGGCVAVCALLIRGVRRNRRRLMLPWLVWYGLLQTVSTLLWFGFSVWLFCLVAHYSYHDGFGAIVAAAAIFATVGLLLLAVLWLWYGSVASYYHALAPSDRYVMETLEEPEQDQQLEKSDRFGPNPNV